MQAGDRLGFIKPFDALGQKAEQAKSEREGQIAVFGAIMRRLVFDRPDLASSIEVLEETGFVTVFEASYRVDMPDQSYLHILAYGHQDDEGLLDAGVSVVEHLDDGTYNGGYMYTYDAKGVRRSTVPPDGQDDNLDEEERTRHFSVIDLYAMRDSLMEMEQSDDVMAAVEAASTRAGLEEDAQVGMMMAAAGFDDQHPHEGELERLADLVDQAYHFPLTARAA